MADTATQTLSPLERLPAELRNRIYALAVVETHKLAISRVARQPALAATNLNIRKEVLPIYFGENTFMLDIAHFYGSSKKTAAEAKQSAEECAKFSKSMKRVGAFYRNRVKNLPYSELHVRVGGEEIVEMTFHGVNSSSPACTCSIMEIVSQKHSLHDLEVLPGHLLAACVKDLNKTMNLIMAESWKAFLGRLRFLATLDDPDSLRDGDCKACKEFRRSMKFE